MREEKQGKQKRGIRNRHLLSDNYTAYYNTDVLPAAWCAGIDTEASFYSVTDRLWGQAISVRSSAGGHFCVKCLSCELPTADHIVLTVDQYMFLRRHRMVSAALKNVLKQKAVLGECVPASLIHPPCECGVHYALN